MKRSTVVVIGIIAVLGGLFVLRRTTRILGGRSGNEVTVQLNTGADGMCRAADPGPVGGAWLHKITFTVQNNCQGRQYAAFLDYHERLDGGVPSQTADNNVVNPDPANSRAIDPGPQAAVPVDVRVRKFYLRFRITTFKYSICVGPNANPTTTATCIDPDFDVWPF